MTGDERARIRHLIRSAVTQAVLPDARLEHPGPMPRPADSAGHIVARFAGQLAALGGAVHEAHTREAIALLVDALARREAARQGAAGPRVLLWNDDRLPVAGISAALRRLGMPVLFQSDVDMASEDRRAELASAVVGVTGAAAGLAESGSVVLASGPGQGRLASLLPAIHVALLERRLLLESLPHFMALHPEVVTSGANLVCITGPSRTADIEHTLTRGVHGPREVHVVLVD